MALGVDPAVVESQERCSDADQLAVNRDAALGSFYVIEGSTLGGRIITRAISRESWAPVGGFATFNPYGDESGAMWREFRLLLNAAGRTVDRDAVVAGARRTFGVLANWLPT